MPQNHTEQTLTQEQEMNFKNSKRIMYEKKTTLPSLRNIDWKGLKADTEKNKWIINTYLNEKHDGIKWTNLCRSEISLGFPLNHEQKLKTWLGNSPGNVGKKSTTISKNDKTNKKRWSVLRQKG